MEVLLPEKLSDLLGIVKKAHADGNDNHLPGGEPERPLARKVRAQDGCESLDAASHGTMNHDRAGASGCQGLLRN